MSYVFRYKSFKYFNQQPENYLIDPAKEACVFPIEHPGHSMEVDDLNSSSANVSIILMLSTDWFPFTFGALIKKHMACDGKTESLQDTSSVRVSSQGAWNSKMISTSIYCAKKNGTVK